MEQGYFFCIPCEIACKIVRYFMQKELHQVETQVSNLFPFVSTGSVLGFRLRAKRGRIPSKVSPNLERRNCLRQSLCHETIRHSQFEAANHDPRHIEYIFCVEIVSANYETGKYSAAEGPLEAKAILPTSFSGPNEYGHTENCPFSVNREHSRNRRPQPQLESGKSQGCARQGPWQDIPSPRTYTSFEQTCR